MKYSVLAPVLLASAARAWLPEDRDLAAFNQTARFEKLGKRFRPSLPSGVTKIRGVNFGGRPTNFAAFLKQTLELTSGIRMAYLRAMDDAKRMVKRDGMR